MTAADDKLGGLFLNAIGKVLQEAVEPDQVLALLLNQAVDQCQADRGVFVEVGEQGGFEFRVRHRFASRHEAGAAGDYSRSLFQHVVATGEAVRVNNALEDVRFMHKESIQNLRIVSILCQPQVVQGRICGILYLESNTPGHFQADHQQMLENLSIFASQALAALKAGRSLLEERNRLVAEESQYRREVVETRDCLNRDWTFGRFIGRSAAVRQLEKRVARAAESPFPLLLTGETGTGKNLVARIVHHAGSSRQGRFVQLFCPSLERGMVESTLFGHRKGAFTGAEENRIGKVQDAENGTLFMDEISTLPLELQPKLLRLLEEGRYERLGDHKENQADLRFIASTNQSLASVVQQGSFRHDLYERLNFLTIQMPPLRERREDIPLLMRYFLDQGTASAGRSGRWIELSPDACTCLVESPYLWPGNVRQVQQLAARLSVEEDGDVISGDLMQRMLDDLMQQNSGPVPRIPEAEVSPVASGEIAPGPPTGLPDDSLDGAVQVAERKALQRILREQPHATRAEQAASLGVSESRFYKLLRKYHLS